MTLIGCTVDSLAVLDVQVGTKVGLRDYFWDKQNPAYLAGLMTGRPAMLTWKFRGPGTFPATDFTNGKYDADFGVFLDDALALGACQPVIGVEHEFDAKTAAGSGTPPQLDDAILHASRMMRAHPLWKSSGAKVGVIATGFQLASRAPAFSPIIADADVLGLDPYATMTATVDAEAGPDMDWIAQHYPTKEVQFGEWGIPTGKPGRAAELAATVALFSTPRYKQLTAAYYWNGGSFIIMGTADQPALVTAIRASLPPAPPDLAAELAAANTQIGTLEGQLAAVTTQLTNTESALTAAQSSNTAMANAIAAARAALA